GGVGGGCSAAMEWVGGDVGEDPAYEVSAFCSLHDDLIVDFAGVHVDEVAVGGSMEGEAPQLQTGVPDAHAQPAFLIRGPLGAGECGAVGYLPHVDHGSSVQRVAELPRAGGVAGR